MAKKTLQSKFNAAMLAGRTLTPTQVAKLGFANVYDAAYKARNFHGLNVQRFVTTNKKGISTSVYALEV